jgi:predicted dehydrogenase/NADPH:quinone reductase-like Zn-dependent oxidoreductase
VPRHLCARIPDHVGYDEASFAVVGSIALQGVRLSKVTLGETVLVVGLGLVGQLAVGLLKAAGARVIGTDLDPGKCQLALKMGADVATPGISPSAVASLTGGLGADAVVITASTKSNGPITLAANAVRQKGRVVLVGVVGLELDRRPFYFKEAEFVVSCSYGAGRYDPSYEDKGIDYPAAYVRWTEQRNIQAVLDMLGMGRLDVAPLISHRFEIDRALEAYEMIEKGSEPYVGIVLQYPTEPAARVKPVVKLSKGGQATSSNGGVGVLGAGNFARLVLLPAIKKTGGLTAQIICSAGGVSAVHTGEKLGFNEASTDEQAVFDHAGVGTVFSITRHDLHARHVLKAVKAGKNIFVEKPLCLTLAEVDEIQEALAEKGDARPVVMVGFNRRFSPAAKLVRKQFAGTEVPLTVSIRFNAGEIPTEHWTQDDEVGGGRIIGEACHAIDLATFIVGSPVVRVYAESISGPSAPKITDDQCFITLRHANGSVSSVGYLAGGDKSFPKERVEVIGAGKVVVIEDFKSVTICARGKTTVEKLGSQDKGHQAEIEAFLKAVQGQGPEPISWDEIRATSRASILAVQSLREGLPFEV